MKRKVAVPLALYLALFCLLTLPLITQFGSHYWADGHDGLQNVWNLWWVDHAATGQRGRSSSSQTQRRNAGIH